MADINATVKVTGVKQSGKVTKFEGLQADGSKAEYTISLQAGINAPEINETVEVAYNIQESEYNGRKQTTRWCNSYHPAVPFEQPQASHAELVSGEDMVSRPAEKAAPVKGPVNSYDEPEIRKNRNIAMSVCVDAAAKIHVALISSGVEFSDEAYANTVLKGYSCYSDFHLEFTGADAVPVSQETRDGVQATPAGQIPRTDWQAEADRAQEPEPTYTG